MGTRKKPHYRTSKKGKKFQAGKGYPKKHVITIDVSHRFKGKSWRKSLSEVADNPDWIKMNIEAIETELQYNNPDTAYLRQKLKNISTWIDEIDKFHYGRK